MAKSKNSQKPVSVSASGRVRQAPSATGGRQGGNNRERQGRAAKRSLVLWISLAALVLLAAATWLVFGRQRGAVAANQATPAPFAGTAYPSQGHQGHAAGDVQRYAHFRYSTDPPTSGFHREIFTKGFVESKPIPKYVQVHLLEHGNVMLLYNCICPTAVSTLSHIADEFDARLLPVGTITASTTDVRNVEEQGLAVIVAPYPGMQTPIALTAWTRVGRLQDADQAKIISFINLYLHNTDNLNR